MQISMNTIDSPLANYALPPGIPALQSDPARLHRGFAVFALALVCLAMSLGYLLGRSVEAGPILGSTSVQR